REALADALVAFNTFPDSETEVHRRRMRLLLSVDELRAHSTLMYADWSSAVAEFVAARSGESEEGLLPAAVAHAALGIALSAYRLWVGVPDARQPRLEALLREGTQILAGPAAALRRVPSRARPRPHPPPPPLATRSGRRR